MKTLSKILVIGVTLLTPLTSNAVSQQTDGDPIYDTATIKVFSKKVEKRAAKHHARVFLIARVGRPKSSLPDEINYTHMGIAIYSLITLDDGRKVPGYAIHSLYQNDEELNKSFLQIDYPIDFFTNVYDLKAGILIPNEELQKRLHKVVLSQTYTKLHNPNYSAISNPFTTEFQNCTEHTLDLIQSAIYQTEDLSIIKARTKEYFKPQTVKVNPFRLLFGSIFSEDIYLRDHNDDDVATATFTSLGAYLQENDLLDAWFTVEP